MYAQEFYRGEEDLPEDVLKKLSGAQIFGYDLPEYTISLTFDDGPGKRTSELLDYLSAEQVPATFFVVGDQVKNYPQDLKKMKELGFRVANHSYSHPPLSTLTADGAFNEVAANDDVIKKYIPDGIFFLRAPYGDWSLQLSRSLNQTYLKKYIGSIYWDMGGKKTDRYRADWQCWTVDYESVETCAQGYINEIMDKKRGIVLMHDLHEKTVDMVKILYPKLKAAGFKFVSLDKVPNIQTLIQNKIDAE